MGGNTSVEVPGGGTEGYHVLRERNDIHAVSQAVNHGRAQCFSAGQFSQVWIRFSCSNLVGCMHPFSCIHV